jgi:DNA-binding protein YbaB
MAIVTTVTIIDERGDKIEVYVNTANEITITVDEELVAVLTPTDARALARLILDAAGLAEEEQEENRKNGYPLA